MSRLVSVIIPAYNAEEYIRRSLESVLEQDYPNLEIIVIDDGSADNTMDIVKSYQHESLQNNKELILLQQRNSGVSAARNHGMMTARGYYICFLDSDDAFAYNGAITEMVTEIEKNQMELLNFNYQRIDTSGNKLALFYHDRGITYNNNEEEQFIYVVSAFLPYNIGYEVWDKLFVRQIIMDHHIKFSEKLTVGEDLLFCAIYLMHCRKITSIDKCLYNYYMRSNSTMGLFTDYAKDVNNFLSILYEWYCYIKKEYGESVFFAGYFVLFAKAMATRFKGHSSIEVLSALKKSDYFDFFCKQMQITIRQRRALQKYLGTQQGKMEWRRYLYYAKSLHKINFFHYIYICLYELYRKVLKRVSIDEYLRE